MEVDCKTKSLSKSMTKTFFMPSFFMLNIKIFDFRILNPIIKIYTSAFSNLSWAVMNYIILQTPDCKSIQQLILGLQTHVPKTIYKQFGWLQKLSVIHNHIKYLILRLQTQFFKKLYKIVYHRVNVCLWHSGISFDF